MTEINLLDLIDSCLCTSIRMSSRVITRLYDSYLEPANINIKQLAILLTTGGMNADDQKDEAGNGVSINDIAQRLRIENSTLSRNLRKLEERGLVNIQYSATNRKEKKVQLTEDAISLIFDAYKYWNEIQTIVKSTIGEETFAAQLAAMKSLTNTLQQIELRRT